MTTTLERETPEPTLGWHEFILDGAATTHIAYVYEDGSIYLPEGPEVVIEADFRLAAAAGRVFPLVRAAGLLVGDPTEEQIERAARAAFEYADSNTPFDVGLSPREWEDLPAIGKRLWLGEQRAALTAAGVAPQEPSAEEWTAAMDAERNRQIARGYDDAHDAAHGPANLLTWALDYARRGRGLAASTMVREALKRLDPATTDSGRCGGCRDLGPHHNVPGCQHYEPEPNAHADTCFADQCTECTPAPSPDREKLITELRHRAHLEGRGAQQRRLGIAELLRKAAAALATPVKVDESKLAEVIATAYESDVARLQGVNRHDQRAAHAVAEYIRGAWLRGGGR